jgi:hypothetical protein
MMTTPTIFLESIRQRHGLEKVIFDDDVQKLRPHMWLVVKRVPRHWAAPRQPPPSQKLGAPRGRPCLDDDFGPDVYTPPVQRTKHPAMTFVFRDFDDWDYVEINV